MEAEWQIFGNHTPDGTISNTLYFTKHHGETIPGYRIELGVIAEGSVEKILLDMHDNRVVRLHTLIYEAMHRLLLKEFLEDEMDDIQTPITSFSLNIC